MSKNQNYWIEQYKKKNALWIHDGNPKRPHALLTSGNHSNGFFNSRLVIPDELLLREAASHLLELFTQNGGNVSKVQGVVGPQTGATKLAELIHDEITNNFNSSCFWLSPAKSETEAGKSMIFNDEDLELLPNKSVLTCEDVITTGGSINLTATAIINGGGNVLPYILVLVNRSGFIEVDGKKIIALINHSMPIWTPEECPLCKQGSEAIRPKGDNWILLNTNL